MSDNFFKALASLQKEKPKEYEYRLYYDKDSGKPLFYSMEGEYEHSYLVITKEEYNLGRYDIRVINGEIKQFQLKYITKLIPKQSTGTPCHPSNIMIVDPEHPNAIKWNIKKFDLV